MMALPRDVGRLLDAVGPRAVLCAGAGAMAGEAAAGRACSRAVNDGLLAGEPDALVESFAGEPELYHPARGRIKGTRAFEAFVSETKPWLRQRNVSVEDVDAIVAAFEPDGYAREPAGGQYTHTDPNDLRAFYERLFSNDGGIRWNTALSSTTNARARWSTTLCGGAGPNCHRKQGSLSTFGVRAASSLRPASTTTPTLRSLHGVGREFIRKPAEREWLLLPPLEAAASCAPAGAVAPRPVRPSARRQSRVSQAGDRSSARIRAPCRDQSVESHGRRERRRGCSFSTDAAARREPRRWTSAARPLRSSAPPRCALAFSRAGSTAGGRPFATLQRAWLVAPR
jgi:hypothetical protein